jgi:Homeodomain-like domain
MTDQTGTRQLHLGQAPARAGGRTSVAVRNAAGDTARFGKRLGKDGRPRPLNAAVGRALAAQLMDTYPDASLRQIAAATGVSPGTVRDVRARLARGEDPSPAEAANRRLSLTNVRNKVFPNINRRRP